MPPVECRDEFSKREGEAFFVIAKAPNKGVFSSHAEDGVEEACWGSRA